MWTDLDIHCRVYTFKGSFSWCINQVHRYSILKYTKIYNLETYLLNTHLGYFNTTRHLFVPHDVGKILFPMIGNQADIVHLFDSECEGQ